MDSRFMTFDEIAKTCGAEVYSIRAFVRRNKVTTKRVRGQHALLVDMAGYIAALKACRYIDEVALFEGAAS